MTRSTQPHVLAKASAMPRGPSTVEQQITLTLYTQAKYAEAEKFAQSLTVQYPEHGFGWKMLGAVLNTTGRVVDSLVPMQQAARLLPLDWEAYNNLGSTLEHMGHLDHAESCYRRAIELKPDFIDALTNLAELFLAQKKVADGVICYKRILELKPGDASIEHLIAMYTGGHTEHTPTDLVTKTFDGYAEHFDTHLEQKLGYKAPEQLITLAQQASPPSAAKWRVLDLGCGTGLVGRAVAPFASHLVGVDLSSKMLEKAQARQLYQRLECQDLLPMMSAEDSASYDLIVAADVFIYVGNIDAVIAQAKRLLAPGGALAFSVEHLDPNTPSVGYKLNSTGRYAHTTAYLNRLASGHGFTAVAMNPTTLRTEATVPVEGRLVLWRA